MSKTRQQAQERVHREMALRQRVDYDPTPPRCALCKFYRPGVVASNGRTSKAFCTKNEFAVNGNAICDKWQSPTGEKLER